MFRPENQMLTESLKLRRLNIEKRFSDEIQAAYQRLRVAQTAAAAPDLPPASVVGQLIQLLAGALEISRPNS
jgi:hypothetical protein